ncbi:hypothetical protein J2S53_003074 [Actinopolyspora lacussalsi]|nr:hypothetical protein [Actinopolyspora lacussalsi]
MNQHHTEPDEKFDDADYPAYTMGRPRPFSR